MVITWWLIAVRVTERGDPHGNLDTLWLAAVAGSLEEFSCQVKGNLRIFLAVQDSSISDIVCLSVPWSVGAN